MSTPAPAIRNVLTDQQIKAVYRALTLMVGLAALDQSIVATALPQIVTELGGAAHLSWVITAYVLASTAVMPLYGKLSDMYGRKPILYAAIISFLLGSVLCGMAQDMLQLIVFRAIQGLGAGGFIPLTQIVIGDMVPAAERGRRQGSIAAVFACTSIVGPTLGGIMTDAMGWHSIFYINLPVGALALWAIARSMHYERPQRIHRIDYLGSVMLTGSVTAILLVLALGGTEWPWGSARLWWSGGISLVLGILLHLHIRRVPEPVLPPDLFRNPVFNIGASVLALAFMGMMGASLFFPLLFQWGMGATPSHAGLLMAPMTVGLLIASVLNGRVFNPTGARYKSPQIVGLALATASFAILAIAVRQGAGFALLEPPIFTLGFGLGLILPNMTIAVQNALPSNQSGVGTAMLGFFRSLGGLVGVTGSGALLAHELHHQAMTPELYRHAIAGIFAVGAVMVGISLLILLRLSVVPIRSAPHAQDPV